ncbi:YccF domain-containing protein [Cellulomonas triticagri]|uniref:YccF domain-containing protein n=1 Tax=Cellulomonas triticagri TaxID=2483352 RepID=A0A3M2IKL9_9CELL|nr:YccF domain-containing protein [Cellulomonas triticagri]RMI02442.1 YccF domain-containing protein [Cellulomonas triticagri]
MKALLNLIWLLFGGLWLALGYVLAGIICCVLIVTIPFGIASFRMASYALWPFGRTIVDHPGAGAWSTIGNVIWVLVAGWWLVLGHLTTALAQAITIIGIPLAIANLKMIPVSLLPLGKEIVPTDRPFVAYGR